MMVNSRKSDYKRIVYSQYVNDILERDFQDALHRWGSDSKEVKLFNKYLEMYDDAIVNRIQPSKVGENTETLQLFLPYFNEKV